MPSGGGSITALMSPCPSRRMSKGLPVERQGQGSADLRVVEG
jgi:hypothetical protein